MVVYHYVILKEYRVKCYRSLVCLGDVQTNGNTSFSELRVYRSQAN